MKNRQLIFTLACSVLLIFLMINKRSVFQNYDAAVEKERIHQAEQEQAPISSTQQGYRKGQFGAVTATADTVYFAYRQDDCVDAFDANGEFLYALLFPHKNNGTFRLASDDGKLYVFDKAGDCHVFIGEERVAYFTRADAIQNGIDSKWQEEHQSYSVSISTQKVEVFDSTGEVKYSFMTPPQIRQQSLAIVTSEIPPIMVVIIGVFLWVTMVVVMERSHSNKSTKRH